jgi:hypothetical protein
MMPVVNSPSKVPADVFEMESRNGKTYYGKELEDLRKQERQEKTRKQLEKDESFGQKASDAISDIGSLLMRSKGVGQNLPAPGSATEARKRRVEEAKKELGMKKGGKVSSASKRADGCAQRGKTRGRMV